MIVFPISFSFILLCALAPLRETILFKICVQISFLCPLQIINNHSSIINLLPYALLPLPASFPFNPAIRDTLHASRDTNLFLPLVVSLPALRSPQGEVGSAIRAAIQKVKMEILSFF